MSVIYFPQISNSITTQLPYTSGRTFCTAVAKVDTGLKYSFPWFGSGLTNFPTGPLGRWIVNFPSIIEADFGILQAFVGGVAVGRLNEFSFLDPGGNLVLFSELLSDGSWVRSGGSISATGQPDPYGGSRATSFGAGPTLKTLILPAGFGNGFGFNASFFVKAAGSGQSATVLLTDNTTTFVTKTIPLGTGWKRCDVGGIVSGNNPVYAQYSVSGACTLFGLQCVASPGPGAYRKTPGSYGYRPKCRLDTDDLSWTNLQFNSIKLSLPITEYF